MPKRNEPAAKERKQGAAPAADVMVSEFAFDQHQGISLDPDVISGIAVVTEGEANGHGVWLDTDFVRKVVADGNATGARGVKARFGHPTMSATSLGSFIGRFKNFRTDRISGKAVARADLYLSKSAQDTPSGNLHGYIISLATEDPKAFGASIVFKPGQRYMKDADGNRLPLDEGRTDKVFVEMAELRAADLVDDPAANPDGLFSQFNQVTWAGQVAEFLDCHPHIFTLLEQSPDVVKGFVERYKAYRQRKGLDMPAELEGVQQLAADAASDASAAEPEGDAAGNSGDAMGTPAPDAAAEDQPKDTGSEPAADGQEPEADEGEGAEDHKPDDGSAAEPAPEQAQAAKSEGMRFLEAFGDIGGVWFAKGLTFEQAQAEYVKALQAENGNLKQRLAAVETEGAKPVSFDTKPEGPKADYMTAAKALAKAEGITMTAACSRIAREQPELYQEYKKGKRQA